MCESGYDYDSTEVSERLHKIAVFCTWGKLVVCGAHSDTAHPK